MRLLAQSSISYSSSSQHTALPIIAIVIGVIIGLCIAIAVMAVVAWLISDALSKVPPEFRKGITPGQVWLLLIPFFSLYWNFIVFQRVPASFRAYFEATGRPQPGDYGKQLGLIFSILAACAIIPIPCVNSLVAITALVLLIILIVKFVGYKNLIVSGGGGAFPVNPPQ